MDAIGCNYTAKRVEIEVIPRMLDLGFLPRYDRDSHEDSFTGERFKCGFDLFEAHLEEKRQTKNGTTWVTVFRGQVARVTSPSAFSA